MKCPNDGSTLLMTSRDSVEIDYCPQCRGVWLDRGELDKLIERADTAYPPQQEKSGPQKDDPRHYDVDDDYKYRHDGHHNKKRDSFLGDLCDF